MAIDTEKTIAQLYEADILLNSNMFDTLNNTTQIKEFVEELSKKVALIGKESEKNNHDFAEKLESINHNILENLSIKLNKVEKTTSNSLNNYAANIVEKVIEETTTLKDDNQKISENVNNIVQMIQTHSEYMRSAEESFRFHLETIQNKQKELSDQLNQFTDVLNKQLQVAVESVQKDRKEDFKKIKRRMFYLFIAIFIGYFIK